jgi:hypothetical protein
VSPPFTSPLDHPYGLPYNASQTPRDPEFVRNADFYTDEHGCSQIGEHLEWVWLSDPDGFDKIRQRIAELCQVELNRAIRNHVADRLTPNVYVLSVRRERKSYRLFFFETRCKGFPEIIFTHCEVRDDWGDDSDGVLSFQAERMRRAWMERNCR